MTTIVEQAGALAVFDLGKTNSKLFVFAPDGRVLEETRTRPVWIDHCGRKVLDDAHLHAWMMRELAGAVERHGVAGVTFSGHGCTFALVADDRLTHPVLDYEQDIPAEISAGFDAFIPPFTQTYTPRLPLGFNYARHAYWLQCVEPAAMEEAKAILPYPQFWVWRFCGVALSECSYLGAHTLLWAPLERDYSSLVDKLGWRGKMAPMAPAGKIVGSFDIALADGSSRRIAVHNGVHDTNAALAYYRKTGLTDFTLVSTGTWVIVINLDCPLEALDEGRDMIANVTVDSDPAPSIRFMGGREYDAISGGWNGPISQDAIERVIARGLFALPAWAPGGPFPELAGDIIGGEAAGEERAAVAALYVVLMSDLALDLIRSTNTVVIDGGLARIEHYGAMLAELRPRQTVLRSLMSEGSATGAAAIAFESLGLRPFRDETHAIAAGKVAGLITYRDAWRQMAEARAMPAAENTP